MIPLEFKFVFIHSSFKNHWKLPSFALMLINRQKKIREKIENRFLWDLEPVSFPNGKYPVPVLIKQNQTLCLSKKRKKLLPSILAYKRSEVSMPFSIMDSLCHFLLMKYGQ